MESIDNITTHLMISQSIFILIHLLILVACIIIALKKKSIATKLLLTGSILKILGYIIRIILNIIAASKGTEAIAKMQVTLSYLDSFIFFVFGLGLLLFAVNDIQKQV